MRVRPLPIQASAATSTLRFSTAVATVGQAPVKKPTPEAI
jgi:hypothetical protein